MFTVLDNAYFKKAQEHPHFSLTHQKVLFVLLHEKKYFSKHELLFLANHSEPTLDKIIKELLATGTIKTEGWLVKINDPENLNKTLIPELATLPTEPKFTYLKKKNMK